jgi:hypothetical protein
MADAVSDKGAHRFTVGCEFTRRVDMSGPQLKRISRIGIDFPKAWRAPSSVLFARWL